MTKKHFQALADALKAERPNPNSVALGMVYMTWEKIVKRVADVCDADNPRFDRARFLKACGVEEGP